MLLANYNNFHYHKKIRSVKKVFHELSNEILIIPDVIMKKNVRKSLEIENEEKRLSEICKA